MFCNNLRRGKVRYSDFAVTDAILVCLNLSENYHTGIYYYSTCFVCTNIPWQGELLPQIICIISSSAKITASSAYSTTGITWLPHFTPTSASFCLYTREFTNSENRGARVYTLVSDRMTLRRVHYTLLSPSSHSFRLNIQPLRKLWLYLWFPFSPNKPTVSFDPFCHIYIYMSTPYASRWYSTSLILLQLCKLDGCTLRRMVYSSAALRHALQWFPPLCGASSAGVSQPVNWLSPSRRVAGQRLYRLQIHILSSLSLQMMIPLCWCTKYLSMDNLPLPLLARKWEELCYAWFAHACIHACV